MSPRSCTRLSCSGVEQCIRRVQQDTHDTVTGFAVPKRRSRMLSSGILERTHCGVDDDRRVGTDDSIRPVRHRHRSFGVVSQREAWDAENCRFLLYASRIGQHEPCAAHQSNEIEIAERIETEEPRARKCGASVEGTPRYAITLSQQASDSRVDGKQYSTNRHTAPRCAMSAAHLRRQS